MDNIYKKIINYIVVSGKRLREQTGKIQDIGITKKDLTEEDLRIERELKEIIKDFDITHEFYAEEENENFLDSENVWAVDPISCTRAFIHGLPHYGIVVSHIHNKKVQFATVYDPSMDELYTAYRGKGAYLNNHKIFVKKAVLEKPRIIFNLSLGWKDEISANKILFQLSNYELYRVMSSHAVNDSYVACGKYNGVVSLTKDSFPYFASSLIIQEAGGIFTNIHGDKDIKFDDRVFVGGDKDTYQKLMLIVKKILVDK